MSPSACHTINYPYAAACRLLFAEAEGAVKRVPLDKWQGVFSGRNYTHACSM
jgi:hypothetical protein